MATLSEIISYIKTNFLKKSGGTISGDLTLSSTPSKDDSSNKVTTTSWVKERLDESEEAAKNTFTAIAGNRGETAGYETPQVSSSAITVNAASQDNIQVTGAVEITIENGVENQAWAKVISLTDASAVITLGDAWTWADGDTPTISANSLLVLYWSNTFGIAGFVGQE